MSRFDDALEKVRSAYDVFAAAIDALSIGDIDPEYRQRAQREAHEAFLRVKGGLRLREQQAIRERLMGSMSEQERAAFNAVMDA